MIALAPAFGALGYIAVRRPQRTDVFVWATVDMFLASLPPYLLLTHPGLSQVYFLRTRLAAITPLAGIGIVLGLRLLQHSVPRTVGLLAALGAVYLIAPALDGPDSDLRPFVAVAAIVAVTSSCSRRRRAARPGPASSPFPGP